MTKFSESIIGKIKCEHIAPVPRWHFLLKDSAFWTFSVFSVILGSLSFSVVMHIINSGDLDIVNHLQGNLLTSAVMLLPYFWLLFLGLFAIVAYFNWKSTKNGYRYKRRWIVFGSVALSVFFGSVFFALGMAKKLDNLMTLTIPLYNESKHNALNELWLQPEKGLLAGKIIEIDENEEKLIVRDENGKDWTVTDNATGWEDSSLEKKGKIVKVIGRKCGDSSFEATEVRKCNNCQDDEDVDIKNKKAENEQ
ncbi:MAG: hypothetical protein US70_C0005G0004 [Parcubacteria group bacterium GW2011_GWD2_38_11]|nr:MAG: hypothetical protein US70_C0005G0004 [Parcubacteria group bacterium GW2011_GWD2_38_11]